MAMSSLRKLFLMDNITGVSLPVPRLSLPRLWCASPVAGTHTHTYPGGPMQGFALPHLTAVSLASVHGVQLRSAQGYVYPQVLKVPGLERRCVGTVVGSPTHPSCSMEIMLCIPPPASGCGGMSHGQSRFQTCHNNR